MSNMVITDYCTGCRTCEQLCSHAAIKVLPDKEGFLAPVIDDTKCVGCNLCISRCPQNHTSQINAIGEAYAIRLKDDAALKRSASGGAFWGFAEKVVSDGGLVVGVTYDENWNALYKITDELGGIQKMQNSKYLQADTDGVYKIIKNELQSGKIILFSGTSCHVAGLKAYLNKDYDNLITIDIICHGVTSPLMFKKYIKWLEEKMRSKVLSYSFRSKNKGWGSISTYKVHGKEITAPYYVDPYYRVFMEGYAFRECCYGCKYTSLERISDITIGDYWGIQEEHPSFYSSKGVSAILLNTEKGRSFFDTIKDQFDLQKSEPNKVANHNINLLRPTQRNAAIRDSFYNGIQTDVHWFENVAKRYKPSMASKIKARIPSWLRVLLKK